MQQEEAEQKVSDMVKEAFRVRGLDLEEIAGLSRTYSRKNWMCLCSSTFMVLKLVQLNI